MRTLVNRPAFDFDEVRFEWGDVVLAAIGWGEWQLLERSLADGLASVSAAEHSGQPADAAALRAAVVRLRRARGLLAGEDYERWLADRSLCTEDVLAFLARGSRRPLTTDGLTDQEIDLPSDPRQLAQTIRGEAILSGRLQSWAERLASCAAAARGLHARGADVPTVDRDVVAGLLAAAAACPASGLDDTDAGNRAPRVTELHTAERRFADLVATPDEIERCLADHRLDWQRFAWEEVSFAEEGAAREAALLVREDELALAEVAGLAHAAIGANEAYADDASELAELLAAAAPGELLGPLGGDGGWRLVRMGERTPPAVDDVVLHQRARTELMQDALGRYLAGRVAWHVKH